MMKVRDLFIVFVFGAACSEDGADITNKILTVRSANCSDYVAVYSSSVMDIQEGESFTGTLEISVEGDKCIIESNSIPNHDFNDTSARFANAVSEVDATYEIAATPVKAASETQLTLDYDDAIFLNGVKLDLLAAACYGVGPDGLGMEKIGCGDISLPWRYDPMFAGNNFGTDMHNAHTQPDGTYHYHGSPNALYDSSGDTAESPVIGFAADGFPIFGPYIDDNGTIRKVVSGYALKSGARTNMTNEGAFPGGNYDGTYRDDYEFTGAGDLDKCNGMTHDGVYGYYVIDSYPWVLACFTGTPDASFSKR